MEEILAVVEVVEAIDVALEAELVVADDILAEAAFSQEMAAQVYSSTLRSFAVFQRWAATAIGAAETTIDAISGLQFVYNVVYTNYRASNKARRTSDLGGALRAIEGTLKKNYLKFQRTVAKQIASDRFARLPSGTQATLRQTATQSPAAYWLAIKLPIFEALKGSHLYTH